MTNYKTEFCFICRRNNDKNLANTVLAHLYLLHCPFTKQAWIAKLNLRWFPQHHVAAYTSVASLCKLAETAVLTSALPYQIPTAAVW